MANRFWVGGTANWDATAGTKWALTSGGAGGQAVPTSADDVFFDGASGAVTCTIASGNTGAKSINCTGFTGTIAGSTAITVSGSVTLVAGMTYTHTGIITITGTGTLTTAGKTFSGVTVSGVGITVTLGDSLNIGGTRTVNVTQGTFDTQNFNLTAGQLFSSNSNTRTINLGSSTLNLSIASNALDFTTSTNLTFNAGTSQINLNAGAGTAIFAGGGRTFYNVLFASGFTTTSVQGQNTFNNLAVAGPGSAGVTQVTFDSRQTINGTLSTTGTAGNRRVWFRGVTYGLAQTLTINSAPSLTDADFRDLYVIGTAAPISGTRIGDLRGNSGITFSTPKTVYWNLAAGGNWSANAWAATSGGGVSTDNFPLAQDTAVIENTGLNTSATVTMDAAINYCGTIDLSNRTSAMTFTTGSGYNVYGNFKLSSFITMSAAWPGRTYTFSGRNVQTITSYGQTQMPIIVIDSYGGTVELADALNIGSNSLTVTNGTFDTKGYSVTAGTLNSNNSNVRAINLGASTLTLSGAVTFTTSTNLSFSAGTSQINISNANQTFDGGGLNFYNVTYTRPTNTSFVISGANTFNNLTITPTGTGVFNCTLASNQTITGTLNLSSASPIQRTFLRSDTLGTTRTLTVNSLSATDCDFRDITIAGAAAGSTPTRAGDCGGNAGITFPAPKTVYWNLAGAQNWSATGWAVLSGGTPNINNFPLAQDTAVFDEAAGSVTGTITINTAWNIGTFNASLRTSAMTLTTSTNAPVVYGDWKFGTGVTLSSTTGTITFAGRGTQTITSNGVGFSTPITINGVTGTVQLADAFTLSSNRAFILTSGTFDAVSYNVTVGQFANGSTSATLRMGSGTWTLSGTSNIWNLTTFPIFYKGTANIVLSDTSTNARTFAGGSLSYNKLTIGGITGTSTLAITGDNTFTELASTKTVAHTIDMNTGTQNIGKWSITGTAGNVVTFSGSGGGHNIVGERVSGVDYLVMGTTSFNTNSPGEFYAGANSTGVGAGVILTAAPAPVTRYWRGGTGTWDATTTTNWSVSSGGAGGASVPTSADAVVFDSLSNATAYTVTCTATQLRCASLSMSAPGSSGNLTWTGTAPLAIHGNVTLSSIRFTRTYTGTITLSGSTTGKTFAASSITMGSNLVINGIGCGWVLGSAYTASTASNTITLTNGSFDTNGFGLTINGFTISKSTVSLTLGSSACTLGAGSAFSHLNSTSSFPYFTFNAGTSNITFNSTNIIHNWNDPISFFNVTYTGVTPGNSLTSFNAAVTYNNLTFTPTTGSGIIPIIFRNNATINGTLTFSVPASPGIRKAFIQSNTLGTTRTITCAAFSGTDVDFRDITIAGAAAPVSGTRFGDCKGNSGITFPAAKTVYWNQSGGGNWNQTVWALATGTGAATSINNFPLAQDTAVFQALSGTLNSGVTVTINAAYNIGTIDMQARTTNTMTLATGTTAPQIYGNWINGTGTTLTGTGVMTFAGRGSQTITSAGKTFTQPITVTTFGGSVTLQDAYISSSTTGLTFAAGTFNANGFNVTLTAGGVISSATNAKTIAVGSSTWILGSTAPWGSPNIESTTITGTGTLSATNASAKVFSGNGLNYSGITLNQGGAGTLTIAGDNTFANITNTYKATGATTIALGTTTQRVGAFGASGEAGRVLTVTGTSASSPATLVFTGSGRATTPSTDYLNITGVRAYNLADTWYAGTNSTNNGSLGWLFSTFTVVVTSTGNMFLMFN
jgi:hypothetical protein